MEIEFTPDRTDPRRVLPLALGVLPAYYVWKENLVPIEVSPEHVAIAVTAVPEVELREKIAFICLRRAEFVVVTYEALRYARARYLLASEWDVRDKGELVTSTFKDYFSEHAKDYSRYRPRYPKELFDWLASLAPGRERAWDCATGNGQAAVSLAMCFATVIATDASEEQLRSAEPFGNIEYRVAPAEDSGIEAGSVDLVTVAQALHWFDFDRFYAEVRRVARPGGIFAAWCYELAHVTPAVDAVIHRLYTEIVGPYWPPERRFIEEKYQTLAMPFAEIQAPSFAMIADWGLAELLGYLGTWSAVRAYVKERGVSPIKEIARDLAEAWGPISVRHRIEWPLHFRVGRIDSNSLVRELT